MQSATPALRQGTCVVSFDVAVSLQSFRSKGLTVPNPDDLIFDHLRQSLLERVARALPDVVIHPIDKNGLRLEIWDRVDQRIAVNNRQAILVTCSEMDKLNPNQEGLNLSINRLFDRDGMMLGYGPRPGFAYLDKQFEDLARRIAGRPVILAKEGAFRGGTCLYILKELEARGVRVVTVIIGFCDFGARAVIEQVFQGELVIIHLFESLIEWIADRDLIPFMPGCGRVVGERLACNYMPIQTSEGHNCAYPYILPFGMMQKWTSLPAENAREMSVFFLGLAIDLFDRISKGTGHEIVIRELLGSHPRVSMPAIVGVQGGFPALNTEVIGFMKQMCKKLE
jgi:hypothetical protein